MAPLLDAAYAHLVPKVLYLKNKLHPSAPLAIAGVDTSKIKFYLWTASVLGHGLRVPRAPLHNPDLFFARSKACALVRLQALSGA
jgi:hypothetical protein